MMRAPAPSSPARDDGFALVAAVAGTAVFAYHNNPLGVRIEIVQRGLFGDWSAFLEAAAS